jgi:hypothetical protein
MTIKLWHLTTLQIGLVLAHEKAAAPGPLATRDLLAALDQPNVFPVLKHLYPTLDVSNFVGDFDTVGRELTEVLARHANVLTGPDDGALFLVICLANVIHAKEWIDRD